MVKPHIILRRDLCPAVGHSRKKGVGDTGITRQTHWAAITFLWTCLIIPVIKEFIQVHKNNNGKKSCSTALIYYCWLSCANEMRIEDLNTSISYLVKFYFVTKVTLN